MNARMRRAGATVVVTAFLAAGVLPASVHPAQAATATKKKEPPACAALSFRPVASGVPDGEQDAGQYRSGFGKIEIKAKIEGGLAKDYHMVFNDKAIAAGEPPAASAACLKSKHVTVPFKKQAAGACVGNRFRVVIDRSGAKPAALFFGLIGDEWVYCSGTHI